MEKEIAVSVIVPVFNVEQYLRKCLDSLLDQTIEEIEIIVVNDGSTDGSQLIIDEYASKYSDKIKPFIIKNSGLGEARNFGVEQARGKYIGFVDSDDWVNPLMYESMYNMTKRGHDIVLCDFMVIKDGWDTGHIAKGFRGAEFNKKEMVINSTDPATACNKIYDRKFFELCKFPYYWYEDIGTTPIFVSYANSIGYLEFPMYFYRQRRGSITYSINERTLGVINAWERVLKNVNNQYRAEAIWSVCKSIATFLEFKSEYADEFLNFARKHYKEISENFYYQDAVKNKCFFNLLEMKLIPKTIHYFWFGDRPKGELIQHCMNSWTKYANDYEIIEWNENNCDVYENRYVREAYEAKKWAFVADYFRIKKIYQFGGIYVDTDVEFTQRIDCLRISNAFFSFETREAVQTGIFGAIPGHTLIKEWLDSYKQDFFKKADGSYNISYTVVKRLSNILKSSYKINMNGKHQVLGGNIKIYSANVLAINVYDGKNIAIHHYDASWWDVKDEVSYKNTVLKDYFGIEENVLIGLNDVNYYQNLIQTYENTLSWKVTLPLRKIRALTKRKPTK